MGASALRFETKRLRYIEDLQQPVKGYDIDIQQVEAGRFDGLLIHGAAEHAQISFGRFTRGLRSRGVWSRDKIVLGMLIGRDGLVTQRSYDVEPGDLVYGPPASEHDGVYQGKAMFAGLAFEADSAEDVLGPAGAHLSEGCAPDINHLRPPRDLAQAVSSRLAAAIPKLATADLSESGARYWRHAIFDTFGAILACGQRTTETDRPLAAAKIVREVEALVDQEGSAPHVAEICRRLAISRRGLHRAFDEILGLGPVTYLRRRRLNAARRMLQRSDPPLNITKVALDHGFDDTGRFSAYYRMMFGEYPSETLKARKARPHAAVLLLGDLSPNAEN